MIPFVSDQIIRKRLKTVKKLTLQPRKRITYGTVLPISGIAETVEAAHVYTYANRGLHLAAARHVRNGRMPRCTYIPTRILTRERNFLLPRVDGFVLSYTHGEQVLRLSRAPQMQSYALDGCIFVIQPTIFTGLIIVEDAYGLWNARVQRFGRDRGDR